MKRILFILFLIFSFNLSAQEEVEEKGLKKPEFRDWIFIDITKDGWLNNPTGIRTKLWSPGTTISVYRDLKFGNGFFGFAFGLGISSHNVHHNGLFEHGNKTEITPRTDNYQLNKLTATYLEAPFELRFRTGSEKPFRIYPGFKFGYLVGMHSKWVDETGKWKFYSFDNADPIRFGPTFRMGYGVFGLYGFYGLNSIFRSGRGPELIPFSIGVSYGI
jgi:hypothetical protein